MSIISVRNLGKQFHLGTAMHNTLRDQIAGLFQRGKGREVESFWALNDVTFDVKQGEVLGIIGHNGAGKSTLLKVLSQITEPTRGEVRIRGRVASLLEVGTGFHPELSGRENIFLNGSILGMSRKDIKAKFDEIVAFAEVEKFLDTPVKHYSSGMYVRLAFAVAAHLEPEILLIDEVLAVGDGAFQKKCMSKMNNVASEGRTIIFVSHSMIAMQSLCRRVILLQKGNIVEDGPSGPVISKYLHLLSTTRTKREWGDIETAPGATSVRLRAASVRPVNGTPDDPISLTTGLVMEFDYENQAADNHLHLSLHVLNEQGLCVFVSNTVREQAWHGRPFPPGIFRSTCEIPAQLLNDGTYRVKLLIVKDGNNVICTCDDLLVFEVIDNLTEMRAGWFGKWQGMVRPNLAWRTEHLEHAPKEDMING